MNLLCYRPQTGRKEIRRSEFEMKYVQVDPEEAEVLPPPPALDPFTAHRLQSLWRAEYQTNTNRMVPWRVLTGSIFPLWSAIKNSYSTNKGFAVRIMKVSLPRPAATATATSSDLTTNETKEGSDNGQQSLSRVDDHEVVIGLWVPNGKIEQVSGPHSFVI
jgi:hypothetical protein